jgi:predicted nucleic acid-binding protein
MSARAFVDTNVLVYADDRSDRKRQQAAQRLITRLFEDSAGVISLQVLQEYFAAARRKLGMNAEDLRRRVELYGRFEVVTSSLDDLLAAIDLHRLHGFSIWDGLIVRSALAGRCSVLYTEDLQHGRRIDGLEFVNPFETHD